MAKVKGIKKLNKAVSAQLAPFGISKAVLTDEYSYHFDSEKVTYKITENDIEDIWFTEFIEERFGYHVENSFIISLLHEVGHHKANEEITGAVYDFCMAEKDRINEEMQDADEFHSKELEWQYFNLPDEIMATQWAVDYAVNHPRKIKKMWENMKNDFIKFYIKNNITGN